MSAVADSIAVEATVAAGDGWSGIVPAGGRLRIVDLHGNQAVDTLLFDAGDPADRYGAAETIAAQGNAYLTTGSVLRSVSGRALMRIVEDTCGRHDTLGGACAQESNDVRYGRQTRFMHACRDTFLRLALERGLDKRDLGPNVNFFMNVPVSPAGELDFADGISAPGLFVELRAEIDVLVLVSNCPQLNNPCNGWNPTPVLIQVLSP